MVGLQNIRAGGSHMGKKGTSEKIRHEDPLWIELCLPKIQRLKS